MGFSANHPRSKSFQEIFTPEVRATIVIVLAPRRGNHAREQNPSPCTFATRREHCGETGMAPTKGIPSRSNSGEATFGSGAVGGDRWTQIFEARSDVAEGPFFNMARAAAYCGYAVGTFERILREYHLPKYGPKKNRFAKSVLDAWMLTPDTFKMHAHPTPRRRSPKPVSV